METLSEVECRVSDLGLREGVLIDLARRITEWERPELGSRYV
jgi:exopolyphosphatase/pppGpp-phosphohydrolase